MDDNRHVRDGVKLYRPVVLGVVPGGNEGGLASLFIVDKDSNECIGPQRSIIVAQDITPNGEPLDGWMEITVKYRIPSTATVLLQKGETTDAHI